MNNLTITYTENDRTVTYSKELPDSPMVDDIIDTYLAAYDSFGFQNDLDVIIRNRFLGDTKISIDSVNHISHEDYDDPADYYTEDKEESILTFTEDEYEKLAEHLDEMFGSEEGWYMGYKY